MPQGYHDNYPVIIVGQGDFARTAAGHSIGAGQRAGPPSALSGRLSRRPAGLQPLVDAIRAIHEQIQNRVIYLSRWRVGHRPCCPSRSGPWFAGPPLPRLNEGRPLAQQASVSSRCCRSPRSASAGTRVSSRLLHKPIRNLVHQLVGGITHVTPDENRPSIGMKASKSGVSRPLHPTITGAVSFSRLYATASAVRRTPAAARRLRPRAGGLPAPVFRAKQAAGESGRQPSRRVKAGA